MDTIQEVTALSKELKGDTLALWSDEKRKDFCKTFSDRVRVTRYLLIQTADIVAETAKKRHFISDKHKIQDSPLAYDLRDTAGAYGYANHINQVGGRSITDLDSIASERADEILSHLPPLKAAVQLISPGVAIMIEQRDKLFTKGKDLLEQSKELASPLDMADLDQDMSIAAFRKTVKDRDTKRRQLLNKLDDVGTEGKELDDRINRFLYAGLPGLSDAVVKVIKDYYEQAAAFDTLNRRVGERVQFGDSDAALDLLKHFEEDEVKVSDSIKVQFDNALETLKLSAVKIVKVKSKTTRLLKGK